MLSSSSSSSLKKKKKHDKYVAGIVVGGWVRGEDGQLKE